MWKQRSRNACLKEGDNNTRYFHYRANQRNWRNHILGIKDETNAWVEDEAMMGGVDERYFENIFTTLNPLGFEDIINGVHHRVLDGSEVDIGGGGGFKPLRSTKFLNKWLLS